MSDFFISDLHLTEQQPEIYQAFCRFLHNLDDETEHLYILGDLFEVWVGEDDKNEMAVKVIAELRLLAKRRIRVFFQPGNRDFLINKKFAAAADIELLPDYHLYKHHGRCLLLMHGDLLCTDDKAYLRFRRFAQNPLTKALFCSLPTSLRRKIGKYLRRKSSMGKKQKSSSIMDVAQLSVLKTMRRFQVTEMIHGHTHRPAVHAFQNDGEKMTRYVLGDWSDKIWWIESSPDGMTLSSQPISV